MFEYSFTPRFVDLGLSVLWRNCNLGAKDWKDRGFFYEWGDTKQYKYGIVRQYNKYEVILEGGHSEYTKYCNRYKFHDGKEYLEVCDDPAYIEFEGSARIPSTSEWYELIEKCQWEKRSKNNLDYYLITGPSGDSITLPIFSEIYHDRTWLHARYLTRNLYCMDTLKAYYVNILKKTSVEAWNRSSFAFIRAVSEKNDDVSKSITKGKKQEAEYSTITQYVLNKFNDKSIKKYVVKENTIKIGDGAFDSCLIVDENGFIDYNLEEVILPKGLLEIGDYAFQDCPIHKLIIPDSVIRIGKGAFSGAQLESIQLPKGLSTIEEFSFCNCPLLKEVHIPNGVTIIMKYAFEGCDQLKQINLPSSVELVCEDAFPRVESFILNYCGVILLFRNIFRIFMV